MTEAPLFLLKGDPIIQALTPCSTLWNRLSKDSRACLSPSLYGTASIVSSLFLSQYGLFLTCLSSLRYDIIKA